MPVSAVEEKSLLLNWYGGIIGKRMESWEIRVAIIFSNSLEKYSRREIGQ